MIVSLNEIAETAKRATSGCGHCFGIAEEMAFAVRWLCGRGFHGIEVLLQALEQFNAVESEISDAPDKFQVAGQNNNSISALTLAPSIADLLVAHRGTRKSVVVGALAHPVLLMPFLARASESGESISARYTTNDSNVVVVNCTGQGTQLHASDATTLIQARGYDLTCQWGTIEADVPVLYTSRQLHDQYQTTIDGGCAVNGVVWDALLAFAHNTYVPSNEVSRLKGAGAGLTDND